MSNQIKKQKTSLKQKENKLIEKIENAKIELSHLQQRRKIEIGKLAVKHGLDAYDNKVIDHHFAKLSQALTDASS